MNIAQAISQSAEHGNNSHMSSTVSYPNRKLSYTIKQNMTNGHQSVGNASGCYRYSPDSQTHLSSYTQAVTVGVTEEMQDSVHSLSTPFRGYYEWKQDYRQSQERIRRGQQSPNDNSNSKFKGQQDDSTLAAIEDEFNTRLIDDDSGVENRNDHRIMGYMVNDSQSRATSDQVSKVLNRSMDPENVTCPFCLKQTLTAVERKRSSKQICLSTLLCLLILIGWPFACLIWRSPNMMDYNHICSHCNQQISTFNPSKAKKTEAKQK